MMKLPAWSNSLLRNPRFSATVIVVLALGIGINVATLGLLYRYYVSPLPYPGGSRIVSTYIAANLPAVTKMQATSVVTWLALQKEATALSDSGVYRKQGYNLALGNHERRLSGVEATASVFPTLGVQPILGRVFGPQSNQPGAQPVVVLSYRLWQTLFDGKPSAIGKTLRLNGKLYTVIGIMPRAFNFPTAQVALWTPRTLSAFDRSPDDVSSFDVHMIGRLAPGASLQTVTTQANAVLRRQIANYGDPNVIASLKKFGFHVVSQSWRASRLGDLHQSLVLVTLATGLLMLLVWFNLANLFLARAFTRRSELTLRRILGANEWSIAWSLARENFLLSLIGAGLGAALGRLLLGLFSQSGIAAAASSISGTSWPMLILIAVLLTIISTGIFTLAGLGSLRQRNLAGALKESGSRASPGPLTRRIRKGLLVAQIALACAIAGSGLLLGRSLLNLNAVNLGFNPAHVVTFKLSFPTGQYSSVQMATALDEVRSAVSRLPGANKVSLSSDVPFDGGRGGSSVYPYPWHPNAYPTPKVAFTTITDSRYLPALGMHLLVGRNFQPNDTQSGMGIAIIDTLAAQQMFGTDNVIGREFSYGPNNNRPGNLFRVIGLVSTAHRANLGAAPAMGNVYIDFNQLYALRPNGRGNRNWYLSVRSPLSTAAVISQVKNTAHQIVPGIPLYDIQTMHQRLGSALASNRLLAVLVGLFAFGALLLAGIGLYAVQAYAVAQRAREFAIRIALGAERGQLLAMVLGEAARLLVIGLVVGLIGLALIGITFASAFYGIAALDPLSMIVVAAVLTLATLAASWLPAWRASRTTPSEALRS
ncbi:MAG: ABC transporter permease [Gammaproteobacteria bacterium]